MPVYTARNGYLRYKQHPSLLLLRDLQNLPTEEFNMKRQWSKPAFKEMRYGFEINMYVMSR